MRLLFSFLLLSVVISTNAQSEFGERSLRYSLGIAGIDGDIANTYAIDHRLAAMIHYDDITFDLEVSATRFNGAIGNPFYYSGTMYFGHEMLPGFALFVGPTFFNRADINEGLFGLSTKTLLTISRMKNVTVHIQTGMHYTSQFVIWAGGIACSYHLK